ncbi:hypothetical protein [Pseudopelagicola sp. nBUS_19]|uniref:hypothetical protein n=1 Tax=Pseudopelagicola sp. nBUS_19 TaxID=3395316 RepID=UPI003EB9174E
MKFIRPEARAVLVRWREALIGLVVAFLGLWWASGFGLLKWLGFAVLVIGVVLIFAGVQRARFRGEQGGPGLVQVDEGEVTYFGPLDGGTIAMCELSCLELNGASKPMVWVLQQPGQPALHVPWNAEGADALFDVFATLPGLKTEMMLSQMQAMPDHSVVIWQKPGIRLR